MGGWVRREPPLLPCALYAEGAAAVRLVERLLSSSLPEGLSGVSTPDAVVILGPGPVLPWVEGVRYLGQPPQAPALRLPTTRTPAVPLDLLERALLREAPPGAPPLALLETRILPLGGALSLHPERLRAWLAAHA